MSIFKKQKTISESNIGSAKSFETSKEKAALSLPVHHLIKPLITEKNRNLAIRENKYVFVVQRKSNKKEIKKAVENLYKVEVVKVNIIYSKSKPKRLGRSVGKTQSFKKAIVTLRKGQTLDVMPT